MKVLFVSDMVLICGFVVLQGTPHVIADIVLGRPEKLSQMRVKRRGKARRIVESIVQGNIRVDAIE